MTLSSIYFGVFLAALVLSVLATPVARRVALKFDFVDRPGGRKIHKIVTPYLGGVAIYFGFLVGVMAIVGYQPQLIRQSASLLVGATLLVGFGLWDDRSGMDPRVKLAGQLAAAAMAVASELRLHLTGLAVLDVAVTLVWIVGLSNAVNLLDNMDGLSSGLVAIASLFLFLLAAGGGQFLVASMAAALAGACLGFLRYNFGSASIFMGDAGSLFLGYMLAVLALKLRLPHSEHVNFAILLLVMAVPILDTTLVTVHRTANGRPVYLGGKDHCSHRLVALGLSRRAAVLTLYALAVLYGLAAVGLHLFPGHLAWLLPALAAIATVWIFAKLGSASVYSRADWPAAAAPTVSGSVDRP